MSTTTPRVPGALDALPMTLPRLAEKKRLGEPIVMVTAYDHPSARVADAAGVDLVLVGDSAANVVLGYSSTVPVSVDELIIAVREHKVGDSVTLTYYRDGKKQQVKVTLQDNTGN